MATEQDLEEIKELLLDFYGFAKVHIDENIVVNEAVADVFGIMLLETIKCSKAFSYIPEPSGGRATLSWVLKQFGNGVFKRSKQQLSLTCARTAIYKWNNDLRMAASGVASINFKVSKWA